MRSLIVKIPLVGYLYRLLTSVLLLPRKLHAVHHALHELDKKILDLQEKTTKTNEKLIELLEIDKKPKS